MRIIAGKYRGRALIPFEAGHIRPTTDRVKETWFNKLMGAIEGARVLDLFSGTGNLAIECLSRGAAFVDLVESHPASLEIIRANLAKFKIESGFKIRPVDVFRFLTDFSGEPYDLVLADPPFTQAFSARVCERVADSGILAPGAQFAIEVHAEENIGLEYPGLIHLDTRRFGYKHLHFFERA